MADRPALFYLDAIRKLRGAPQVTSPQSNAGSLKIERVYTIALCDAPPEYGDADPDPGYAALGARLTNLQVLGQTQADQEVYTCHEALGTREQQDLWNRRDSYPYALATFPRLTRTYRFFFDEVPGFAIGSTTDTEVTDAVLISLLEQDENAVVKQLTATFDAIPSIEAQATQGDDNAGIPALGVSITYPESPYFPVLLWAFRVLKADYVPPASVNLFCPIPGFTDLAQTDEKASPSDDSPLVDVVTREYQMLSGAIVESVDAARLPRTLTAIPGTYLNGDTIIKTVQKVPPGTQPDALVNGILSSKIDAASEWCAVKTNFARASQTYPVLYAPRQLDEYGGTEGLEYRQIIEGEAGDMEDFVDDAIAAMLSENTQLQVISYSVNVLSPTQSELVYTVVESFVELVGAEYSANIPEKFLTGFTLETDQDWIDTTTLAAASQLVTTAPAISCKITPLTPYRAKRVTTKLPAGYVLPTLIGHEEVDGQDVTVTETIAQGTQAITFDATMLNGSGVVPLGGGLTLKTVRQVTGYPQLVIQEYDKSIGIVLPATEQIMSVADAAAFIGQPFADITPIDGLRSRVRISGVTTAEMDAYKKSFVLTVPLDLPDELFAVIIEQNGADGNGSSSGSGSASETGGGTLNCTSTNSAESSAAILLDAIPIARSLGRIEVAAQEFYFLVPDNTSPASVMTKLSAVVGATVNPKPIYQKVEHTLIAKGKKVSLRTASRASLSLHFRASGEIDASAVTKDVSGNQDVSVTSQAIKLRPCINQAITLTGPTSATQTATAASNSNIAGFVSANVSLSLQAGATITPSTLPASPGTNAIPTAGLYVERIASQPFAHDYVLMRVIVVDMGTLGLGAATAGTHTMDDEFTISRTDSGGFTAPPNASGQGAYQTDAASAPPVITQPPTAQTANAGDTVTLSAQVTGTYPLTFQWSKDGAPIDGAAGSMYIISSFDPGADSGDYTVAATNVNGTATTDAANLSQTGSTITITQQPQAQTVADGSSATLSVTASGGTLTYQWRFGGNPIAGATGSDYTISPATSDSDGSYDVVISNALTSVTSNAASVAVIPMPTVTVQPTDQTVASPDGSLIVSAAATGTVVHTQDPLIASLLCNGTVVNATPYITNVSSVVNGQNIATSTYEFIYGTTYNSDRAGGSSLPMLQAGAYTIKFVDAYGNSVQSNSFNVTTTGAAAAPTITTQPSTVAFTYNPRTVPVATDTLSLSMAVSGTGPFVYQWQRVGVAWVGGNSSTLSVVRYNALTPAPQSYNCKVYAEGGNVTTNTVLLKPYFLDFNTPSPNPNYYASANASTTVPVQMNFFYAGGGGVAPDEPFTITLSQQRTDGTAAHGTFSTTSFTSVTHTTGENFLTAISNYTPSATDAGHDVRITGTASLSGSPVTGTIGNAQTIIHITT